MLLAYSSILHTTFRKTLAYFRCFRSTLEKSKCFRKYSKVSGEIRIEDSEKFHKINFVMIFNTSFITKIIFHRIPYNMLSECVYVNIPLSRTLYQVFFFFLICDPLSSSQRKVSFCQLNKVFSTFIPIYA